MPECRCNGCRGRVLPARPFVADDYQAWAMDLEARAQREEEAQRTAAQELNRLMQQLEQRPPTANTWAVYNTTTNEITYTQATNTGAGLNTPAIPPQRFGAPWWDTTGTGF